MNFEPRHKQHWGRATDPQSLQDMWSNLESYIYVISKESKPHEDAEELNLVKLGFSKFVDFNNSYKGLSRLTGFKTNKPDQFQGPSALSLRLVRHKPEVCPSLPSRTATSRSSRNALQARAGTNQIPRSRFHHRPRPEHGMVSNSQRQNERIPQMARQPSFLRNQPGCRLRNCVYKNNKHPCCI
jgi:hypothetical protein